MQIDLLPDFVSWFSLSTELAERLPRLTKSPGTNNWRNKAWARNMKQRVYFCNYLVYFGPDTIKKALLARLGKWSSTPAEVPALKTSRR